MKLAAFPKCFINDLSEGRMDLFDWIRMSTRLECDGLELYDKFLASTNTAYLREVRQAVEDIGMTIPMLCYSPDFTIPDGDARKKEVEKQKQMIHVAAELGAGYCRTLSGQRRPEVPTDRGIEWVIGCITECLPVAAAAGVKLVIENHYKDGFWEFREFAQKSDLFLRIVESIDSPHFGVQYDPSNAVVAGEDPILLLDAVLRRVMTMHASDRFLKNGTTLDDLYNSDGTVGYMDGLVHGVTGEGLNDYDAIFKRLSTLDRDIWVSIEDGENGLDEMKRSIDFLKEKRSTYIDMGKTAAHGKVPLDLARVLNSNSNQQKIAEKVMPGGVNSSVRIHGALGVPFFVSRSEKSYIFDLDGNGYIDMCCAHGAALLGHRHPAVVEAVSRAAELGFLSVFETPYHEELARRVCDAVPCADMVRFCSSGSEATLHMIRACRAFTKRDKIIRVEGHFHGYHELIYIGGHPPEDHLAENRTTPYIESDGIPDVFRDFLIPIPYNDPEALEEAIRQHAHEAGTLVLEPVNYNCGGIKPDPGYLELARKLTAEHEMVLFFDEIQSGFKKSPGGAQADFGVIPDVAAIGKSLGGGSPLSAFCGRKEIMSQYKPLGTVQHSGTFNAHLVPVLTGLAFLKELDRPDFYPRLRAMEKHFHSGIDQIIANNDLKMVVPHHGPRFDVVLGRREAPRCYSDTFCHDNALMVDIWKGCMERGVYFHDYGGAPVHHGYSIQHSDDDMSHVLSVLEEVLTTRKDRINRLG